MAEVPIPIFDKTEVHDIHVVEEVELLPIRVRNEMSCDDTTDPNRMLTLREPVVGTFDGDAFKTNPCPMSNVTAPVIVCRLETLHTIGSTDPDPKDDFDSNEDSDIQADCRFSLPPIRIRGEKAANAATPMLDPITVMLQDPVDPIFERITDDAPAPAS